MSDTLSRHRQHLESQRAKIQQHQEFLRQRSQKPESSQPPPHNQPPQEYNSQNQAHNAHSPQSQLSLDPNLPHEINLAAKGEYFLRQREEKLNLMRRERQEQETEELRPAPTLSDRTRKLISRSSSSFTSRPLEDELMEKEWKRREAIMAAAEKKYHDENPGTPKITPHAAQIVRDGSVTDRLYELAAKLGEKKRRYMIEKRLREEELLTFQPKRSTPHTPGSSFSSTTQTPVFLDLLQRDEQSKLKRIEKIEKLLEKERELHKPKINPVSEEIASRLPVTSKVRLLAPKKAQAELVSTEDAIIQEFPFRPQICQRSKDIANERNAGLDSASKIERLYQREKLRREKIEDLKNYYDKKEMEECTFTPVTHGFTVDENNSKHKTTPFNERLEQWQHRRETKIKQQKRDVEQREMENCTFHPNIKKEMTLGDSTTPRTVELPDHERNDDFIVESGSLSARSRQPGTILSVLSPSISTPVGFEEFVKRQEDARKRKKEQEEGIFVTGDKWKNRITVPKEFKLGNQRAHNRRKAIKRPPSPSYVQKVVRRQLESLSDGDENEDPRDKFRTPPPATFSQSPAIRREELREMVSPSKPPMPSTNVRSHTSAPEKSTKRVASSVVEVAPPRASDDNLAEFIPRQGLFSARSSLSILDGLNYNY